MKTNLRIPVENAINSCVRISAGDVHLLGDLQIPEESTTLVIFADGRGRSRHNPRCRHTAQLMRNHGIGTLNCELLSEAEEMEDQEAEDYCNNAELLAKRLIDVTQWACHQKETANLRIGYFGACAGAAAALIASIKMKDKVHAVVSRSGRTDLAIDVLARVKCPTLLIVGDNDTMGKELNREAMKLLHCEKEMHEVVGASHLFGEPGKIEEMSELSAKWFLRYLWNGDSHGPGPDHSK